MRIPGISRRQLVGLAGVLSARIAAAARIDPAKDEVTPGGAVGAPPFYAQTAIEAAAQIKPVNFRHASGPARYGALGDGATDDQPAWASLGKVADHHFVPWLTYLVRSKICLAGSVTLVGASRSATIQSSGFDDYVLEVGQRPTGPNAQAGTIERLKIQGARGNKGLLHFQQLAHMWHVQDLLLYNSPCAALVIDGCWDSNYENIDIIQCCGTTGVAANDAAVILRNGCNNLFFRSLRIEQAAYGSIYVGNAGPVYLLHGKVDLGYIKQHAAAVTVTSDGALVCSSWAITGLNLHPAFAVQGDLTLGGGVTVVGGSGVPAIQDTRAWSHVDTASFGPGAAQTAAGPYIPRIDLGDTQFTSTSIYVNQITPAVIQSKIFPIRIWNALTIIANGGARGNTFSVFSDYRPTVGYAFVGCYLVNNQIGTQPAGRRKILASFSTGQLTLQGTVGVPLGSDYSIEYCGGHYTPIQADAVQMSPGMELFAVLQSGATISGAPRYVPVSPRAPHAGCTRFAIHASSMPAGTDAAGYYLIDEQTGEPFLIGHGIDAVTGEIGVLYDRTAALESTHTFSIAAGYLAGINQCGNFYEWSFGGERHSVSIQIADRLGFDPENMPLWAFARTTVSTLSFSSSIRLDTAISKQFVISATSGSPFSIDAPALVAAGERVLVTIKNASSDALGVIVWARRFKTAPWISPAPGFSRSIEFLSDGDNLVEINRTAADVPN
jgi:hypothetical protein